jgi:hypothetical protein
VVGYSSSGGAGRTRARAHGAITVFAVLVLWSATAQAETELGPSGATRWYGYQLVAVDLAALTLFAASQPGNRHADCVDCGRAWSSVSPRGAGRIAALTLYGAVGPSFHAAHGRWDKAGLSLGLRVTPWLIGLGMRESANRDRVTMVGSLCAMLFDWVLLAHETQAADPSRPSANRVRLGLRGRTVHAVIPF